MHLDTVAAAFGWPDAAAVLGIMAAVTFLIVGGMAAFVQLRKTTIVAGQEDNLRQLVRRYEQLAEGTLDAQQASELGGAAAGSQKSQRS
jgi:hypothetical protein